MKLVFEKKEKEEVELFFEDEDYTLLNMLKRKLLENKDVSVAGYEKKHPLKKGMHFIVKTRGKNAVKAISKAVSELGKEWEQLEI